VHTCFLLGFLPQLRIYRDSELRKEFYKSAASQLTLQKAIGVSQMEKELENNVRSEKRLLERTGESQFEEQQLEQGNVKEILHDVLNELYYSKDNKETQNSNHGR
jgi:hypothetical protein